MKKRIGLIVGLVFLMGAVGGVSAQGFYFDIGLGAGFAWTKIDGLDFSQMFKDAGLELDEIGADVSLKAGYGPLGGIPLYIAGELGGVGHRLSDSSGYLQFNSYILGAGVIYYPLPLLQLAADIGFSWTGNTTDMPMLLNNSTSGFAADLSAAVDLGNDKHGCLIGAKYFIAVNKLENSGAEQKQSGLSIFVKYAFRHRR